MAKKEPLCLKLTKKQLCNVKKIRKVIDGLRRQSVDIAFNIGRLEDDLWDKIREYFPETKDIDISLNWLKGEVTEVKDC